MENILGKAEYYVSKKFEDHLSRRISYHNLAHTREVVDSAREIGEKFEISTDQMEILLLAAWFHDVGIIEQYHDHEERSAELCNVFLAKHNYPADKIERIAQIILSTRIPQKPAGILEEIMCDADLSHSGKKIFNSCAHRLRMEWENMLGKKFSDYEWLKTNINFLEENKFHTKHAKILYNEGRKTNLTELQQKLFAYKITPPPKHKSLS